MPTSIVSCSRNGLALAALCCLAACVARPIIPPAVVPAPVAESAPPVAAPDLPTLLASSLAGSGTVLPPRLGTVLVPLPTADGSVQTVAVTRASFSEAVFFDFDRDALWPDTGPVIDALARSIGGVPGTQLTIVGHTDAVGTDAYNIDLSRRRALAVMQALVGRGVDPAALSTVAVGKRQPVAPDDTPQGRAENRRVDFFLSPSLPANLAAVAALPGAPAAEPDVAVLRAAPDPTGRVTLAAVGALRLQVPAPPPLPAAEAPLPEPAAAAPSTPTAVSQPVAPPPTPALPALAPPAVPRSLPPDYRLRTPGDALTY